jgi:hypothetical protein
MPILVNAGSRPAAGAPSPVFLAVVVHRDRGLVAVLHRPDVLGAERRVTAEETPSRVDWKSEVDLRTSHMRIDAGRVDPGRRFPPMARMTSSRGDEFLT